MSSESMTRELIEVERRGWDALCSADAAAYYGRLLTDDALMAFPFGVLSRDEALKAIADARPWSRYDMHDPRVVPLGADSGVVVYSVTAHRDGQQPFTATMSSTFVRRGGEWRQAFHQQSFQ